jgi:hypothetical protein
VTPLDRFLSRFLPRALAPFALAAVYALALATTILASGEEPPDLRHLDVQDARR